ncbi:MAG: hypothetical protein DMG62_07470 [Acidobacteria bacterium]|nr:MAG: hypothetical protein DMG62_07470 [Acidobacteriota bacterium]
MSCQYQWRQPLGIQKPCGSGRVHLVVSVGEVTRDEPKGPAGWAQVSAGSRNLAITFFMASDATSVDSGLRVGVKKRMLWER